MLHIYMMQLVEIIVKSKAPDKLKWKTIEKMTSRFCCNRERFFRLLIVSGKLNEAEMLVKEALANNMSVLLGLHSTNFAGEHAKKNKKGGAIYGGIAFSSLM